MFALPLRLPLLDCVRCRRVAVATLAYGTWSPDSIFKLFIPIIVSEVAMKDGGAMADNSYEGAFGANGYGAKSSERLLQVRGKRFQHEKTKKKRTFNGFSKAGGQISQESFSTKFQYSDDE